MRKCSSCGQKKNDDQFFYRDKQANKLHCHCKACYAEKRRHYKSEHYRKYGDLYRARAKIRKQRVQKGLKRKLLAYLGGKSCESYGIGDPRVLDFDHIDAASKSFSVARGLSNCMSWEIILAEIDKCRILCANCHRIRTAEQFNWYRR